MVWGDKRPPGERVYSRNQPAFPHEPTSDQWFSESQFESYRKLGEATVEDIIRARSTPAEKDESPCVVKDVPMASFEEFLAAALSYISDADADLAG